MRRSWHTPEANSHAGIGAGGVSPILRPEEYFRLGFKILPYGIDLILRVTRATQVALELAAEHGLQIRDALILSVCAESKCRILLSEDMQHGFAWSGVTVVNPFTHPAHPRLLAALD